MLFDSARNGRAVTEKLVSNGDGFSYLDAEGKAVKGMYDYGGNTYFFDENAVSVSGWMQINGNVYYFEQYYDAQSPSSLGRG